MTSFLRNLITIARQELPTLRPRPVSLFEGFDTAEPIAANAEHVMQSRQPGFTAHALRESSAGPTTTVKHTESSDAPPQARRHHSDPLPERQAMTAKVDSATAMSPQQTILKVIREVQAAAPAPILTSAPVQQQPLATDVASKTPPPRSANQPIPKSRKAERSPLPPNAAPASPMASQPSATTHHEKSVVHHARKVERHHTVERVRERRTSTTLVKKTVNQPQPGQIEPRAITAAVMPQLPPRSAPSSSMPTASKADTPPMVTVSIGTVEIQATAPPRQSTSRLRVATPSPLSLDDYLQQRTRGGFE